ncbi:MAG: PilZ domain-containing protein [Candidatus Eisenbacteria bacterium]|nr:PilZ domain-containing protein [Candidatus Eisenbacteria bacterium]
MPQKRNTRRNERRRTARADAHLSMRVESAREDGEHALVVTESQNISASGVYCMSSHYLAPLSRVGLTIVLPRLPGSRTSKELVKCEGIVVRCEPAGTKKADARFELACMFTDLDPRRRSLLEEFVTWRNLRALRAAAAGVNGRPAARGRAAAGRTPRAARKPARRTAATRRGAVH